MGVDVEEAVKLALMDLKLPREEVEITVLEEPSKGFFGIGSKLAKVRVERKKPEPAAEEIKEPEIEIKEEPKEVKTEERTERPANREKKNRKKSKKDRNSHRSRIDAAPLNIDIVDKESLEEVEEHEALTFLKDITEKMGLSLSFRARVGEDTVYLEMDGKDSGTVIGKRGQTLDAIQYLTSLVVNKTAKSI